MKLAHIINVTEIDESKRVSYLHIAQPVTMKSMTIAKEMAQNTVEVDLFAVKHKSEQITVPDSFLWTGNIDKYAFDCIEALKKATPQKPLPCLVDILQQLYDCSDADYFIYTNVDIGLQPHFYTHVFNIINQGFDAFCINRRDIPKEIDGVLIDKTTLELAYKNKGEKHPGTDCFIFQRELFKKIELNKVFVGFPPVGKVLKIQLQKHARRFALFPNEYITFHIGKDCTWNDRNSIYFQENIKQGKKLRYHTIKDRITIMLKQIFYR